MGTRTSPRLVWRFPQVGRVLEHDVAKGLGDVAAGSLAVTTVLGWLPDVAAALAIIWTLIRIYEWVENRWFKK